MSACEKAHAWEMALYLLFHLWHGKLQPDVIALNCGLSACAAAQRWEEALKLGADAKSMAIQLSTISYNSLITALNVGQDFHHAREVQVFEEMLRENVTVDIITFNSLIGACMRRADWCQALQWLRQIEEVTLEADRVTYGTCLAVLDQAEEWQRSLEVLEKAICQGIEASGVLITSTMAACDRAGMWQSALILFDVAVNSDGADIRSFNTALRAIAASGLRGAWRRALHLLSSMTSHHIIADCKSFLAISDVVVKSGQVKELPWVLTALSSCGLKASRCTQEMYDLSFAVSQISRLERGLGYLTCGQKSFGGTRHHLLQRSHLSLRSCRAVAGKFIASSGYGSGWSFSKCGHIWKRSCCFAKRGSLATCPTAVGESTRSKGASRFDLAMFGD